MRLRACRALPLGLALFLSTQAACGKRADPLAPYVKTPLPPTALEVAQIGTEVQIRVTAPRTTTENRPLPVIELQWLQAPPLGVFERVAIPLLREEVAPGEIRTKRFPRPPAEVRLSVQAISGKARSALFAPVPFKPAPVPETPTGLEVTNVATGVELRWTNPPGAEPWPSPSPIPRLPGAVPGTSPLGTAAGVPTPLPPTTPMPAQTPPAPTPIPAPTPTPTPQPTPTPPADPTAGASPAASPASPLAPGTLPSSPVVPAATVPSGAPLPSPTPPTGIRIFRTDGVPRLAREPIQASAWTDLSPKAGEKPCYSIRYATSFSPMVESQPTEPVCVDVKDIVAPDAPPRLVGDIGDSFVELTWTASPSTDVTAYRLYLALDDGTRKLVLETPGTIVRARDNDMTRGPRSYVVIALDAGGNESAASPVLKIVVP
jgi:hypothetical protein